MRCYCVIHMNVLVGVYSSAVDAHLVAKQLLGSVIHRDVHDPFTDAIFLRLIGLEMG